VISEPAAQEVKDWGVRFALVLVLAMPALWAWFWLRFGRGGRR
jgi:hypothetical protein